MIVVFMVMESNLTEISVVMLTFNPVLIMIQINLEKYLLEKM